MNKRVSRILLASLGGRGQRYLRMFILTFACLGISEAVAQVCCPAGCVQNNNSCVTTGPNPRSCSPVACNPGSGGSGGGSSGTGTVQAPPNPPQNQCFALQPTQVKIDDVTNNCVASLVANAQFVGCLFEDDAGRAEDKRTDLTCADRQAALAKQCRSRCATFAQSTTRLFCNYEGFIDQQWQAAFGDIGGNMVGSARVQDCGPPLKPHLSVFSRLWQALSRFFK